MISYREELKRKAIHLSSFWMVAAILLLDKWLAFAIFAILALVTLLSEMAYIRKIPVITPLYGFLFGGMLREEQKNSRFLISRGFHVLAAAALNTLFFASVPAAAGMAVMLGGDTAAALIGRKWGRHKMVNGKSFEGFAGFFITGLLLILLLLNIYGIFSLKSTGFAVAAVLAGDLAELFEKNLHIDDNFSIALVVGGIMQLSLLF